MGSTTRRQLILSICTVVLISLIFVVPQADADFNEDFESYANGEALDQGANPNGWSALTDPVSIRFSWSGNRTINGGAIYRL